MKNTHSLNPQNVYNKNQIKSSRSYMNSPSNQSQGQVQSTPYGSLNLEVREARMYALMKDDAVNFICNIFITFSESELNNHDEIAKSMLCTYVRY
jgi:hypothetical protein